jgi:4-amino-4-deoxy-L-arabinose transferase-like glycosyltransferase
MSEPEKAGPPIGGYSRRAREVGVVAVLTVLGLLLFFHRLGSLPLFDADEPTYAEAAREMLLSGDWITPHLNYQPLFDKPILFYWLIGVAYIGFGIGEFAARFWSAVFAIGLVLSIYLFGRQMLGPRGALIAALAFATNVGTATLARAAVTDMTLAFFMTWTLFSFFAAYRSTGTSPLGYLFVAYLTMALAVLTKGPIGLLIPLVVIGLFVLVRGRARATCSRLRPLAGFLLFAVVALPWYLLVLQANGWDFVQGFFVKHHLVRATGVVSGHRGPIYYFLPVAVLGFFPWSSLLPKAFGDLWSVRARLRGDLTAREETLLFAWLWFGVVFVLFSLSGTKLPSYIFPAFPALALLAGAGGEALLCEKGRAERGGTVFDWLVGGIACFLAVGFALLPLIAGEIRLREAPNIPAFRLGPAPYLLSVLSALGPALAVWSRRRRRGNVALAALAATMVMSILLAVQRVVPAVEESLQKALREFAHVARRELGPADHLVAYDLNAPSVVFYSRRQVVTVRKGQEAEFHTLAASSGRILIIAKAASEPRLMEVPDIFPLDRRGGYVLYSSRPSE